MKKICRVHIFFVLRPKSEKKGSGRVKARTDLASELREEYMKKYAVSHKGEPDGIKFTEKRRNGVGVTEITVENEKGAVSIGKPVGRYITVNVGKIWQADADKFKNSADIIAETIVSLSRGKASTLVVGLGNRFVTADAIGPCAASHVIATRHIKEKEKTVYDAAGFGDVAVITPGVLAQTGYEASEQIKAAAGTLKPERIIIIDALAAKSLSVLETTVQITDTGICPGSGVGNDRGELSEKVLGTEVISIGVPTIVDTATLILDMFGEYEDGGAVIAAAEKASGCYVCPKDTDKAVEEMSRLIGYAVNKACHRMITYEEMAFF